MGLNNVDSSELERVFRFFDADQSGKITLNELLRGLRVRGTTSASVFKHSWF